MIDTSDNTYPRSLHKHSIVASAKSEPLVSIVVPVYNNVEYVERAIQSILRNTYRNIEVILVDDGSTDGSSQLCDSYAARDTRIQVIHQLNSGVSSARNAGIELSRGQYIMFVDSDDEVTDSSICTLLRSARETGAEITTGAVERVRTDAQGGQFKVGSKLRSETLNNRIGIINFLSGGTDMTACARLYQSAFVKKHRFLENIRINEDKLFIFETLKFAKKSVYIDSVVYRYHQIDSSTTHSGFSEKYFDIEKVADRIFEGALSSYPGLKEIAESHRLLALMELYTHLALSSDARGRYKARHADIRNRIVSHKIGVLNNDFAKMRWVVIKLSPVLYALLSYLYRKLHSGHSKIRAEHQPSAILASSGLNAKTREPIDVVIMWVDGTDPSWLKEKLKHSTGGSTIDDSINRYRDWDNLQYIFRGIEKFMPWVRKIHFVTYGHVPSWLDLKHEKLDIVKHEDFIPSGYLPTFSSHPIELNLHRIKGLSEKFILFNDDMFVLRPVNPEFFFTKEGKPIEQIMLGYMRSSDIDDIFPHILLNNSALINMAFDAKSAVITNLRLLLSFRNGYRALIRNIIMMPFSISTLPGVITPHMPSALLKNTLKEVWDNHGGVLDSTSRQKFRSMSDVNQYVFKQWQVWSGRCAPFNISKHSEYVSRFPQDLPKLERALENKKCYMVCVNDTEFNENFEATRAQINTLLDNRLHNKSSFEN